MCILGPYIIQFSAVMNIYYMKGYFKRERWKKYRCRTKIRMFLVFTILGLVLMPIIDLVIKIVGLIILITLPCKCRKINRRVRRYIE